MLDRQFRVCVAVVSPISVQMQQVGQSCGDADGLVRSKRVDVDAPCCLCCAGRKRAILSRNKQVPSSSVPGRPKIAAQGKRAVTKGGQRRVDRGTPYWMLI